MKSKANSKHEDGKFRKRRPRKKRGVIRSVLRGFLFAVLFLLVIGGAAAAGVISGWISSAPDVDSISISPSGYATYIYDADGRQMQKLTTSDSNRTAVSLSQVPVSLQHAVVAIEDERFYQHGGIDIRGILRAAVQGVRNGFHFSEGASTITQQLIKNNVFTDWTGETTMLEKLKRKAQEQYLAVKLEKKLKNKDLILENYLNTINLGAGTYGVEAASRKYFNKDVSALSLSEATVIAGITQNPAKYNPIRHPEANAERRKRVLTKMAEQGYITQTEMNECLADDVYQEIADAQEAARTTENTVYSWFVDALTGQVVKDLEERGGYSETQAYQLLYSGGLRIYTTQDQSLQAICDEEYAAMTEFAEGSESSLVLMDQSTGAVKAIVGGSGKKTASLTLNRAVSVKRQPGSTFKILSTYAPAIDSGKRTIGSYECDEPYAYADGTEVHDAEEGYLGWIPLRQAIVHSVNVVAVKVLTAITPKAGLEMLEKFGFTTLDEKKDAGQALALGGITNGVTNLELTAAYAAIADGGVYMPPAFYTKITDMNGNTVIDNSSPEKTQVISRETAWILTDAMKGVVSDGTGTDLQLDSAMAVAGKTGTTSSYRDLWFVGYTPYYTMGIWYGYDDNTVIPEGEQSRIAHKLLWKRIMDRIAADETVRDFEKPETVRRMKLCGLSDMLPSETCQYISDDYVADRYVPTEICNVDGDGLLSEGQDEPQTLTPEGNPTSAPEKAVTSAPTPAATVVTPTENPDAPVLHPDEDSARPSADSDSSAPASEPAGTPPPAESGDSGTPDSQPDDGDSTQAVG